MLTEDNSLSLKTLFDSVSAIRHWSEFDLFPMSHFFTFPLWCFSIGDNFVPRGHWWHLETCVAARWEDGDRLLVSRGQRCCWALPHRAAPVNSAEAGSQPSVHCGLCLHHCTQVVRWFGFCSMTFWWTRNSQQGLCLLSCIPTFCYILSPE